MSCSVGMDELHPNIEWVVCDEKLKSSIFSNLITKRKNEMQQGNTSKILHSKSITSNAWVGNNRVREQVSWKCSKLAN